MVVLGALNEAIASLELLASQVEARSGAVRVQRVGGHVTATLDNPGARNALTVEMMLQLSRHVRDWAEQPPALLHLRHEGPVFCAGGHLTQVREALTSTESARLMSDAMSTVLDALLALPSVVVVRLDGLAVGGGAELLTAADLVMASERARVHFVQAELAIATGWGGAVRLVRRVGRHRALRLLLGGAVDADTACELGLVDVVLGDADFERFVQRLASLDGDAVRACKRQVTAQDQSEATAAFLGVWGGSAHLARLEEVLRRS